MYNDLMRLVGEARDGEQEEWAVCALRGGVEDVDPVGARAVESDGVDAAVRSLVAKELECRAATVR